MGCIRGYTKAPRFKRFAVVIITSSPDQDTKGKAKGLGFTDLLEKPFRMDDLYESVQRALAGLET